VRPGRELIRASITSPSAGQLFWKMLARQFALVQLVKEVALFEILLVGSAITPPFVTLIHSTRRFTGDVMFKLMA
jgi:hypothetical protein